MDVISHSVEYVVATRHMITTYKCVYSTESVHMYGGETQYSLLLPIMSSPHCTSSTALRLWWEILVALPLFEAVSIGCSNVGCDGENGFSIMTEF